MAPAWDPSLLPSPPSLLPLEDAALLLLLLTTLAGFLGCLLLGEALRLLWVGLRVTALALPFPFFCLDLSLVLLSTVASSPPSDALSLPPVGESSSSSA